MGHGHRSWAILGVGDERDVRSGNVGRTGHCNVKRVRGIGDHRGLRVVHRHGIGARGGGQEATVLVHRPGHRAHPLVEGDAAGHVDTAGGRCAGDGVAQCIRAVLHHGDRVEVRSEDGFRAKTGIVTGHDVGRAGHNRCLVVGHGHCEGAVGEVAGSVRGAEGHAGNARVEGHTVDGAGDEAHGGGGSGELVAHRGARGAVVGHAGGRVAAGGGALVEVGARVLVQGAGDHRGLVVRDRDGVRARRRVQAVAHGVGHRAGTQVVGSGSVGVAASVPANTSRAGHRPAIAQGAAAVVGECWCGDGRRACARVEHGARGLVAWAGGDRGRRIVDAGAVGGVAGIAATIRYGNGHRCRARAGGGGCFGQGARAVVRGSGGRDGSRFSGSHVGIDRGNAAGRQGRTRVIDTRVVGDSVAVAATVIHGHRDHGAAGARGGGGVVSAAERGAIVRGCGGSDRGRFGGDLCGVAGRDGARGHGGCHVVDHGDHLGETRAGVAGGVREVPDAGAHVGVRTGHRVHRVIAHQVKGRHGGAVIRSGWRQGQGRSDTGSIAALQGLVQRAGRVVHGGGVIVVHGHRGGAAHRSVRTIVDGIGERGHTQIEGGRGHLARTTARGRTREGPGLCVGAVLVHAQSKAAGGYAGGAGGCRSTNDHVRRAGEHRHLGVVHGHREGADRVVAVEVLDVVQHRGHPLVEGDGVGEGIRHVHGAGGGTAQGVARGEGGTAVVRNGGLDGAGQRCRTDARISADHLVGGAGHGRRFVVDDRYREGAGSGVQRWIGHRVGHRGDTLIEAEAAHRAAARAGRSAGHGIGEGRGAAVVSGGGGEAGHNTGTCTEACGGGHVRGATDRGQLVIERR